MRSQQECILSGGVHLRHRLERQFLPFLPPKYSMTPQERATHGVLACWRARNCPWIRLDMMTHCGILLPLILVFHHSQILGGNNRIMVTFQIAKNSIHAPKNGISCGSTWHCWLTRASKARYKSVNG